MTNHDRVRANTAADINRLIRERTDRRIDAIRDDPERIRERLAEIDAEWDIERALQTASAALSLFGVSRALRGGRGWLGLPLLVQGFLLQHALQGWCPPLPVLRSLGFRTQPEIERERYTLRAVLRDRVDVDVSDRPAEMPAERRTEAPA
jgi:hypothetical protein